VNGLFLTGTGKKAMKPKRALKPQWSGWNLTVVENQNTYQNRRHDEKCFGVVLSKWRPAPLNCLYVIPDVHGMLRNLNLILKRILPLRKSDGGKDKLIFLGDYIDRNVESAKVVDRLIELKKRYKNQIIFLKGNHEEMLQRAIVPSDSSEEYLFWMINGGEATLKSYLERAKIEIDNPYTYPRNRIKELIPKEHLDFYDSLELYHESNGFIFVHAGCDPNIPLDSQDTYPFLWDRSIHYTSSEGIQLHIENPIIAGHNSVKSGKPLITKSYMMLDCSTAGNLLVVELNTMEAFIAIKNNDRLLKYSLETNE
jgi:serine/threonine protein phosphatase 1